VEEEKKIEQIPIQIIEKEDILPKDSTNIPQGDINYF
jgi:hypothetical protein